MCSWVRCARRLDAAAASSSPNCWPPGYHALPSIKSPPFPPLHTELANAPDELLAHLLEARLLHRREIARHLAILIMLKIDQDENREMAGYLSPVQQARFQQMREQFIRRVGELRMERREGRGFGREVGRRSGRER